MFLAPLASDNPTQELGLPVAEFCARRTSAARLESWAPVLPSLIQLSLLVSAKSWVAQAPPCWANPAPCRPLAPRAP